MEGTAAVSPWGWLRAVGLLAATGLFTVVDPWVLIAVPFGLLVFFMPPGRVLAVVLAAGGMALVALGEPTSGLWYVERGWALLLGGCFLALSLRWPGVRFLPRGLGAVVGAFLGTALLFWVRPGDWAVVDWAVRSRMDAAVAVFLQVIRENLGPEGIPEGLEAPAMWTIALPSLIFPAVLGLVSLSALGFAWWLHKRLGRNPEEGIGPLREFRFNDQLIWVLILGILALLASSGVLERIGANAVVFMGALYAQRGAAVVLFLTGGISFFGGVLLLLGFLFVAPFVILGAVFFGLGDTWFDLRARRASTRSGA
ncbi:MAG: DUF2232 domain-containing protein [Longimicrobiales bacterium]|nr:DUF2232 domain-containing protein [Longimicrobiales bacterium]